MAMLMRIQLTDTMYKDTVLWESQVTVLAPLVTL